MGTAAESSLGTRDVAGLLSAHWPPVTDRIACCRPAASIGPFGSSWLAILALRNPGLLRIMSKKQALQTRGSCRREEGKRGERGDQRSDSLAIQKVCRASLGAGWKKLRVCEPVRQCIRGPKEFEPNKMLTPFRTDEVEQSERDLTAMSSLGSEKKGARTLDAGRMLPKIPSTVRARSPATLLLQRQQAGQACIFQGSSPPSPSSRASPMFLSLSVFGW